MRSFPRILSPRLVVAPLLLAVAAGSALRAAEEPAVAPQPAAPAAATDSAQHAAAPAAADALAAVAWLAGRWEGSAWMERGGQRYETRSIEIVERRIDGQALVVEGIHYAKMPDGSERKVHHALGMLVPSADGLRFATYVAVGRGGEFPARLEGDSLVWEIPSMQTRYQVHRDEQGRWVESGTVPAGEGQPRREVFHMVLQRVE